MNDGHTHTHSVGRVGDKVSERHGLAGLVVGVEESNQLQAVKEGLVVSIGVGGTFAAAAPLPSARQPLA